MAIWPWWAQYLTKGRYDYKMLSNEELFILQRIQKFAAMMVPFWFLLLAMIFWRLNAVGIIPNAELGLAMACAFTLGIVVCFVMARLAVALFYPKENKLANSRARLRLN